LGLDLTIGLILIIAQQIQKIRCKVACTVGIEKYAKTEKSLVISFWTFFQISQQTTRIRKNRNHQKLLLMQGYLPKENLEFS